MLCESRKQIVHFVILSCLMLSQIEALLVWTSSLLFLCHLPSCLIVLHFGARSLSSLYTAQCAIASCHSTRLISFCLFVFHFVLPMKDQQLASSAHCLFWRDSAFLHVSYTKINVFSISKGRRRLSTYV